MSFSALKWAHAAVVLAGGSTRGGTVGSSDKQNIVGVSSDSYVRMHVVHARTIFRVMDTNRLNSGMSVERTSTCYGDHIDTS